MPDAHKDQPRRCKDKDELALDALAVYSIRLLCGDMVDRASSGHLGTPFGCAPLANALWGSIMKFSPNKRWLNRDRFVLSVGHASALLYSMLHLVGTGAGGPYEVCMEQLKQFRQAGSSTPGHPEFRMTSGVEVTTGPLGQGFANAVGMAISEAHLAARFNREGFPLFDHYTYVLAGDGCLMEGVAQEDVGGVFAAKGWNVLRLEDGNQVYLCFRDFMWLDYVLSAYEEIVEEAKSQKEKPTIIIMKTTIGCGAGKGVEATSKAHGGKFSNLEDLRKKWHSPAGLRTGGGDLDKQVADLVQQELDALAAYGSPDCSSAAKSGVLPKFYVPRPVLQRFRSYGKQGDGLCESWEDLCRRFCETFRQKEPAVVKDLEERLQADFSDLRSPDVASSVGAHFPSIQGNFLPPSLRPGASYAGRYIHFGVREHACLAILNGICSYSALIPYASLFTVFFQYGMPALRMASISKFPVLYIGTHDSIDLGEDGPTHQPVEVLPQLRAMPNFLVIRPADVEEVVGAFRVFAEQYTGHREVEQYIDPKPLKRRPVFIMTSRGELGLPYKSNVAMKGRDGVLRGAYVVHDCCDAHSSQLTTSQLPDIILIGSGQDVALVMETKALLLQWSRKVNQQLSGAFDGFPAAKWEGQALLKVRVVSMPCWEIFDEQDQEYQDSVLLSNFNDILRIYVEKAATKNTGHDKYAHFSILMPSYGLSGKAKDVEKILEFTPEYVAAKVWSSWIQRGRRLQLHGDRADQGTALRVLLKQGLRVLGFRA
ncbi:TKL1 [Symbiodinium sp. CCMP2456]|nr:TKL1 [Symbiodinium sp. CCMP2456]